MPRSTRAPTLPELFRTIATDSRAASQLLAAHPALGARAARGGREI